MFHFTSYMFTYLQLQKSNFEHVNFRAIPDSRANILTPKRACMFTFLHFTFLQDTAESGPDNRPTEPGPRVRNPSRRLGKNAKRSPTREATSIQIVFTRVVEGRGTTVVVLPARSHCPPPIPFWRSQRTIDGHWHPCEERLRDESSH